MKLKSFLAVLRTKIEQVVTFFGLDMQLIGQVLLALIATFGVVFILQIGTSRIVASSVVMVVVFALILVVNRRLEKLTRGERILQYCLSLLLAVIAIIGAQLDVEGHIFWSFASLIKIACAFCTFLTFFHVLISAIKRCNLHNWQVKNSRKLFWITFAVIAGADLLVLLASFPGVYHYDAGYQMSQFLSETAQLTTHYSLLYSGILSGFVQFGISVFHSAEIGFAIYAFLQMIFMSFVATKVTIFTAKKTKNSYLYLFAVAFFAFFPFFTVAIVSSMQDVFFAGIFALIFLNLIELVEDKDYWQRIYKPITLAVLILLLCLFRNNGIYCMICVIPFALIFCKNRRLLTVACIITPLVVYEIIVGPIYQAMGVIEYDTYREMASVPTQQLARVYNYNNSVLTEEDKEELFTYYSKEIGFDDYMPSISDPVKWAVNNDVVKNDLVGFLKLWARIGLKDPENYIEGFLMNTLGFWFPGKNYPDMARMYHIPLNYDMLDAKAYNPDYVAINRTSLLPLYDKFLQKFVSGHVWQNIPVVSNLVSGGSYFLLFICTCGVLILRKKWKLFVPFSLVAGLYITLFLSPVALFRYYLPVVVIMPTLVGIILNELRGSNSKA